MTDYLKYHKDEVFPTYGCDFHFDFYYDSCGEMTLSFWISYGFENVYQLKGKCFTACDYHVNKLGIQREVEKAVDFCERMGYKEIEDNENG